MFINGKFIYDDYTFELLISDVYKFICCSISKNGCSSILASILHNDFNLNPNKGRKVWEQHDILDTIPRYKFALPILSDKELDISNYSNYKTFMILRNPRDRFISYINTTYADKYYRDVFDKQIPSEIYINKVLDVYPYWKNHDRHAVPQRVYYEKYMDIFKGNLDIVMIEDLPEYYTKLTGKPFIKNNITKPEDKVCTWGTLTEEQKNKIEKYIQENEFTKADTYSSYWNA